MNLPRGDGKLVRPGDIGVSNQEIDPSSFTLQSIAESFGLEFVKNLKPEDIDSRVARIIPEGIARKHEILAIRFDDGQLTIVTHNPNNISLTDGLSQILDCRSVVTAVASREDILTCLRCFYSPQDGNENLIEEANRNAPLQEDCFDGIMLSDEDNPSEPWSRRIVDLILREGLQRGSSDIRIEPQNGSLVIRLKIDGSWVSLNPPPKLSWEKQVVSLLKTAANMDISETRRPLDGKIRIDFRGKKWDIRLSSIPTINGETLTLRILDPENATRSLSRIGFCPSDISLVEKQIQSPDGIILVTGPTGSGKTSTLYACLKGIDASSRNLLTLEDPVEYQIPGISQTQVNEAIGFGFSQALRACLRQAPDVILVGELRDKETVDVAIKAALTGHLVLSTLHTNDSISTVIRLLDMGIQKYLIAEALRTVIAQRLVRLLCRQCSRPFVPSPEYLEKWGLEDEVTANLKTAVGCDSCYDGFSGRSAIHEILVCGEEIRNAINASCTADEMRSIALNKGMRTLRQRGLELVLGGFTTREEVSRLV